MAIDHDSVSRARLRWPWFVFGTLLALALPRLPREDGDLGLDESWQLALGHFFKHRAQAGVDYIWTYGPLGWLTTTSYDPDLLLWKYAWEVVFACALAVMLTVLLATLPTRSLRLGGAACVLLLVEPLPDTLYPAATAVAVILLLRADRRRPGVAAAVCTLLAAIALTKFTYLIVAAGAWLILVVALRRERARALEALLAFPVVFAAVWCAAGQHLANLPAYVLKSGDLAAGYAPAMAMAGPDGTLWASLALLAMIGVFVFVLRRPILSRPRHAAALMLLAFIALIEWRHSFVRQPSHAYIFFNGARLLPWLVLGLATPERPKSASVALLLAILLVSFLGWPNLHDVMSRPQNIVFNARDLLAPGTLRQRCAASRVVAAAERALPRLAARIGDGSVDVISFDQATLLLNGFRYRPRPVFQSYAAYTPRLLKANADFYRGPNAPDWVMLRLAALDDRLPTMEDGPALVEILRRYEAVEWERDILLLRRFRQASPADAPAACRQGSIAVGEEFHLEYRAEGLHLLSIRVERSIWGRVGATLLRPSPVFLRLRLDDGSQLTFRLVPEMAETPFLIDPLLLSTEDVRGWYEGRPLRRAVAVAVVVEAGDEAFVLEPVGFTLWH